MMKINEEIMKKMNNNEIMIIMKNINNDNEIMKIMK